MTDSPYRAAADFVLGEPTHCLFCGEERLPDGGCRKCHAWSGASPSDETPEIGFPCPRCKTVHLRIDAYGRAKVKICDGCHGMFVPALQFSFILNDYVSGVTLPVGSLPPPPPTSASAKIETRVEKIVCIACHREMDRLNFASRSGAIIDVCNVHGMWLDAGELVVMLHFIKTRAELGEVPLSDAEIADSKPVDMNHDLAQEMQWANDLRATYAYVSSPPPRNDLSWSGILFTLIDVLVGMNTTKRRW